MTGKKKAVLVGKGIALIPFVPIVLLVAAMLAILFVLSVVVDAVFTKLGKWAADLYDAWYNRHQPTYN